jgi:hypothetical protein
VTGLPHVMRDRREQPFPCPDSGRIDHTP